jgi:hypothetical protein
VTFNEALKADPLKFASKYSLKGDDDARRSAQRQGLVDGYVYSKMTGLAKISYLDCRRAEKAMELLAGTAPKEERDQAQNEGADTIVVTTHDPGAGLVPAWFMPWNSAGGTVSLSIPSKVKFDLGFWQANAHYGGSSGKGKIVEEYPTFFLTAAINGCSVFVTGASTEPKIFHSGSGGTVEGDAVQVWRDMVLNITGKSPAEMDMAEVNKTKYVKDGTKSSQGANTTRMANRFEDVLNRYYEKGPVQIKEVRPWGAVFGVCDEFGSWTFYLQENATIRYDVVEKKLMKKTKRHPFSVSRPMTVRRIFPGGGGAATMRSDFAWRAL